MLLFWDNLCFYRGCCIHGTVLQHRCVRGHSPHGDSGVTLAATITPKPWRHPGSPSNDIATQGLGSVRAAPKPSQGGALAVLTRAQPPRRDKARGENGAPPAAALPARPPIQILIQTSPPEL